MPDKSEKECFDGMVNSAVGPPACDEFQIVSLSDSGHHIVYHAVDRAEYEALTLQNREAELNHKKAVVALYLATAISFLVLGMDFYMTAVHGLSYKTPEWVLGIISSIFLGAGSNQLLAFVRALKREPKK